MVQRKITGSPALRWSAEDMSTQPLREQQPQEHQGAQRQCYPAREADPVFSRQVRHKTQPYACTNQDGIGSGSSLTICLKALHQLVQHLSSQRHPSRPSVTGHQVAAAATRSPFSVSAC